MDGKSPCIPANKAAKSAASFGWELWDFVLGWLLSLWDSVLPDPGLDLLQLRLFIYQENANLNPLVRTSVSFISFRFFCIKKNRERILYGVQGILNEL